MYGRELLTVCHHPGKFCEHRHCDSGDIVFLICHVISREHTFKGLCEFRVEEPLMESHHLPMFGGHWSSASGNMKYLICHVTS